MKGKNREGLQEETPLPLLQMELLQVSAMGLPAPGPSSLGEGCHRAVCHSESSGSQEVRAGHHRPLGICKAVGHWHTRPCGAYLTTLRTGGACVQVPRGAIIARLQGATLPNLPVPTDRAMLLHCLPAHPCPASIGHHRTLKI